MEDLQLEEKLIKVTASRVQFWHKEEEGEY